MQRQQWMNGGHKEAHKATRKVHFVTLMDIRHIQKYEYIPWNVRKINLKCGNNFVLDELVHSDFFQEVGSRTQVVATTVCATVSAAPLSATNGCGKASTRWTSHPAVRFRSNCSTRSPQDSGPSRNSPCSLSHMTLMHHCGSHT